VLYALPQWQLEAGVPIIVVSVFVLVLKEKRITSTVSEGHNIHAAHIHPGGALALFWLTGWLVGWLACWLG
jgi:hypothetical protein